MKQTIFFSLFFLFILQVQAQNPFITHMYTADPTARVMNDKLFVFPSVDIPCKEGEGNNGFCMPYYHAYSTENLVDWVDHGKIVDQTDVPWGKKNGFGMWAPDCIEKDGKYYFYFPDIPTDSSAFRRIGIAIANQPEGPYEVLPNYMEGVNGIDPNVFIDQDGAAYFYWGGGEKLYCAKLKPNMIELDSEPQVILKLPKKYKEGPFLFKRNGIYYFTFPHAPGGSEELAYATGKNPLGPFDYKGLFMQRWKDGCWTNHHSVVEYKNQWMVFYHHNDISKMDKLRSMRADYLEFNEDGTIQEVIPSFRGIGNMPADRKIHIDRYSAINSEGISIKRMSKALPANWLVADIKNGSWLQYDRVDFSKKKKPKFVEINAAVQQKGQVEIREGSATGTLIAVVELTPTKGKNNFNIFRKKIKWSKRRKLKSLHHLNFIFKGENNQHLFDIDWIRFQ